MMAAIKLPRLKYVNSFKFLEEFLIFSECGLPVDPSMNSYYQHRIAPHHTAEEISFSVFLHAIWHCFVPAVELIRLNGMDDTYQPAWIADFWSDSAPVLIGSKIPSTDDELQICCQVFDLRAVKIDDLQIIAALPAVTAANMAVFLISDGHIPNAPLARQTPFGTVSFFSRDEWEIYHANLV